MKLLDTTFLIDYWDGLPAVRGYLEDNEGSEFLTTTLNLKEIAVGQALAGDLDRHTITSTFDWADVVSFEPEHAFRAATLEAEMHRDDAVNGAKINSITGDLLIGAVAQERGATVVTRNTDDFDVVGVSTETY